jgi:crotonobetainyl-CoA:carnitine CoA-transferase CaiB-like acyl-CoA transferase
MKMPLEGVRVVEVAQYVAGPLCGVLLAELGAEVLVAKSAFAFTSTNGPSGGVSYARYSPS